MKKGVSIVICCHNSADLLPATLAHLKNQEVPDFLPWEVIVVDNASTDDTGQVALKVWGDDAPSRLYVVREPTLGVGHARRKGVSKAKFEFISFIDDDNWVSPDWVAKVFDVLSQKPNVGACGGWNKPAFEETQPWWFQEFQGHFAVGPRGQVPGDVTETGSEMWSAGLNIRKNAWEEIVNDGLVNFWLEGRKGKSLGAGEDSEICYGLRRAGWKLWYEPSLKLQHFLPASRLNWMYLRGLNRGFGRADVGLSAYRIALSREPLNLIRRMRRTWIGEASGIFLLLLWKAPKVIRSFFRSMEGDPEVLYLERLMGRLSELLRWRWDYDSNIRKVLQNKDDQFS